MKYLEFSDEAYARLQAAAEAEGVSPAQWIANLVIRKGLLSPDHRVEDGPESRQRDESVPPSK